MRACIVWLLILCTGLQPVVHLALAESVATDRETAEKTAREFRERAGDESDDRGLEEHGSDGAYHAEYTDAKGNHHELTVERQIEVVQAGDGLTAFREAYKVTTHDIPPPREARLVVEQGQAEVGALGSNDRPFHLDLDKFREYQGALHRAQPEPDRQDIPSRIELETEVLRLNAATQTGAAITDVLSAKLTEGEARFGGLSREFEPPELALDELAPTDPLPSVPYNPHPARSNTIDRLEKAARKAAESSALDAIDQAVRSGLISEIGQVLTPRFVRLGAFLEAHSEELRAGAELTVDIAVTAIPVASIAWGLANLASIAIRGTTVLGTPVQHGFDIALLAIGAAAPALPIKRITHAIKHEPLIGGLVAKEGKTTGAGASIAKTLAKTNSRNLVTFLAKAAGALKGSSLSAQPIYNDAALARIAERYSALETKMAMETGMRLEVNEVRAIVKEYKDVHGASRLNTEADVFKINPSNRNQNHRFSLPGNEALYSATGPNALELAIAETERPIEQLIIRSRTITYERVLDLTNPGVRQRIAVTETELRRGDYEITHQIGDIATQLGFDAIRTPSAKGSGDNIVRLVKP